MAAFERWIVAAQSSEPKKHCSYSKIAAPIFPPLLERWQADCLQGHPPTWRWGAVAPDREAAKAPSHYGKSTALSDFKNFLAEIIVAFFGGQKR